MLTIGNFDGVHLGHQKLIATALNEGQKLSGQAFVYTFNPHPQIALRPETAPRLLTTYQERVEILSRTGISGVIEEPFSREFSQIDPAHFFKDILITLLGSQVIVVGYDFSFGRNRAGNLEILKKLCEGSQTKLIVVSPQSSSQVVVSSSKIRELLSLGNLEEAKNLLGYPFFYKGDIVRGDGRGKKIGIATANMRLPETENKKILLPHGVYATKLNGYISATNIGVRPTFENTQPAPFIETHIIDPTYGGADQYGQIVEVQFFKKIRDEKKFDGVDLLVAQIQKDIETVKGYFNL